LSYGRCSGVIVTGARRGPRARPPTRTAATARPRPPVGPRGRTCPSGAPRQGRVGTPPSSPPPPRSPSN